MSEMSTENPWGDGVPEGVWVFVALYMVALFVIGGYYGNQLRTGERDFSAKDHFLAGRNLGVCTAALSLYASSWSGYTEVGAPGESYSQGFNSFRWIPGNVFFACFIGWMAPRIHFYSHNRNYEGTADFISDRFRNTTLTLTIVVLQIFPVCLYVMGQLSGIGTTMAAMSGNKLSEFSAALIFVLIMLFYEMVGGMHAIAKTDVIQASILLFGFMLYFVFQGTIFGGLSGATEHFLACARLYDDEIFLPAIAFSTSYDDGDVFLESVNGTDYGFAANWSVYDYYAANSTDLESGYMNVQNMNENVSYIYMLEDQTNGCELTPGNEIEPANADDHLTINPDKLSGWLNYHIGSIPFIVYPHIMDRYYASKDVKTMKMALHLIHISLWISALPSIIIGIPVSAYVNPADDTDMTNISDSNSVFATFLMYLISKNDFLYIFGCLICAAAFAAYMSTADSGLMGFSSMISLDVLKHYVPPFNDDTDPIKRQRYLVNVGKVLSFTGAMIALFLVTLYEGFPLGDLYVWQGSFLFQTFPAFLFGMFCPWICSYSVTIGCWVGFMIVVMMEQGTNNTIFPNVFYSFIGNFSCVMGWEFILRITKNHPGFEPELKPSFQGFGPLNRGYVGLSVGSVGGPKKEPFEPYWATVLVLVLAFLAIPYWASYDNYEINYIGGVPYWGVITIFLSACATTITILQCIYYYDDWMVRSESMAELGIEDTANAKVGTSETNFEL